MSRRIPLLAGLGGGLGLIAVYFGIVTAGEGLDGVFAQFAGMWYWVLLLALGFGVQAALFAHMKIALRRKTAGATAGVAASGGVSTVAMAACCAHHVTDVLPFLGLSAASVFLVEYQTPFIVLGVFSNLFGIAMMLKTIQDHGLHAQKGAAAALFSLDMRRLRNATAALSAVIVALTFADTALSPGTAATPVAGAVAAPARAAVETIVNDENSLSVAVTPVALGGAEPPLFKVAFDTHQGGLDFAMTDVARLEDDRGNVYRPTRWDGPPPGGHHLSGTLAFPPISADAAAVTLIIADVYGVPERVFRWAVR